MTPEPSAFDRRAAHALADDRLRAALRHATGHKDDGRRAAWGALRDVEGLRDHAARIKRHTMDHLDYYLEQFVEQVQAAGGQVHRADDAAQAREQVVRIARENGLVRCVKAKSMLTEEIELNPALEAAGIDTVETDLGEFVAQLAHERPSHIVTPIIHKTRREVGQLFSQYLGVDFTDDPQVLTAYARLHLREVFRQCDLGITGVNFGVASTGSLCLVTNEGNGRMAVSRPRVHIALMGIEKLTPRMADLSVFLQLLARSGTAQPLTVYTTLITGPRRAEDPDGPEQLHVILVDNGRSRLRGTDYQDALNCLRCGACLNACPVYRVVGGHTYDTVYPGPIGKVLTPLLSNDRCHETLPHASSLCGACLEACPVKIDLPAMLVAHRRDQVALGRPPLGQALMLRLVFWALRHPRLYRLGQRLLRRRLRADGDSDWSRPAGGWLGRWGKARDMRRPAARTFHEWWERGHE